MSEQALVGVSLDVLALEQVAVFSSSRVNTIESSVRSWKVKIRFGSH